MEAIAELILVGYVTGFIFTFCSTIYIFSMEENRKHIDYSISLIMLSVNVAFFWPVVIYYLIKGRL